MLRLHLGWVFLIVAISVSLTVSSQSYWSGWRLQVPASVSRRLRSIAIAVGVTILATLMGVLGGLYPEVFKKPLVRAFGPVNAPNEVVVLITFAAGLLLLITLVIVLQNDNDADKLRTQGAVSKIDEATVVIREATGKIKDAVETLPPASFRKKLKRLSDSTWAELQRACPRTLPGSTRPQVAILVRLVLRQVIELAQEFDDDRHSDYSANVMIFIPRNVDGGHPFEPDIYGSLRLIARDHNVRSLRGVLTLYPELTSVSKGNEIASDPHFTSLLSLPVAQEAQSTAGHFVVLPGAPLAFLTKRMSGYVNTASLLKWCDEDADFTREQIETLEKYFTEGPGTALASFVSFPLIDRSGDAFGVVNLNSARTGVVGAGSDKVEVFASMLAPFLAELGTLAELWKDCGHEA